MCAGAHSCTMLCRWVCGCAHSSVCRGEGCMAIGLVDAAGGGGWFAAQRRRQQEEHLRLSWHQVLLSCLNESNLPSPSPPSLTKQISFAVCSSPLIQLPQARRRARQRRGPSLIGASPLSPTNWHKISPIRKARPLHQRKKHRRRIDRFPLPPSSTHYRHHSLLF